MSFRMSSTSLRKELISATTCRACKAFGRLLILPLTHALPTLHVNGVAPLAAECMHKATFCASTCRASTGYGTRQMQTWWQRRTKACERRRGGALGRENSWGCQQKACSPVMACLAGRKRVEPAQAIKHYSTARKPAHALQACQGWACALCVNGMQQTACQSHV